MVIPPGMMMSEANIMEYKPDEVVSIHDGLREISFLMRLIDNNCAETKTIVSRLSEKYNLSKKTVRQLASEYVLRNDFTTEPTVKDIELRLATIGDESSE